MAISDEEERLTAQKGEPMAEKKLSEELRHCLEDDDCGDCQYRKPETKFTCKGLLQKAYERIKEYEEMEDRDNGKID